MDTFDLLGQRGLWHVSGHGRGVERHLLPGCPQLRAEPVWGPLAAVADPDRWCRLCAGSVRAILAGWHGTSGTSGEPRLVLARLGHPVLQPPARWLLEPLLTGVCAEPGRLTRWAVVVGARTAAWLAAVGADPAVRAAGHRLEVFDGPATVTLSRTAAALWDPFSDGTLRTAAEAVTAARRLVDG